MTTQPPTPAALKAAQEIGDEFYFTDEHVKSNLKGREHEVYDEIAAIIDKHTLSEQGRDALQNDALQARVDQTIKEIRQQQERPLSFWTNDLIKLIRDLHTWLGTERTMHAAWRKRAEEAERALMGTTPPPAIESAPSSGDVVRKLVENHVDSIVKYGFAYRDFQSLVDAINRLLTTEREHLRTAIVGLVRKRADKYTQQGEESLRDDDVQSWFKGEANAANDLAHLIEYTSIEGLMKGGQ